ncbi:MULTISPECIES: polyprenyl synthetase family protein [Streptomyces]|uniref:polyprenyl synthetase family protein n=1 Tax=Streptomyces TaxID=1883 RepID=UPI00365CBC88
MDQLVVGPASTMELSRGYQVLAAARASTDPALRSAISRLPRPMSDIASYHFGWSTTDGMALPDQDGSWGKGLRPALALVCAEAVGADPGQAVPAAVAVELIHNASLIHDDIIDNDPARRHRPSVWRAYDRATAILAGNSLFFVAVTQLATTGPRPGGEGVTRLADTVQELIQGEQTDHLLERRDHVSLDEALSVATAKTAALLRCACELGAYYGRGTPDQIRRLGMIGESLGTAFQLTDDLLGIWGSQAQTGKPDRSDLTTRKKTVPVITALASDTPAGRELTRLYHQPVWDQATTDTVAALIEEAGGRQATHDLAGRYLRCAHDHLQAARLPPKAHDDLDHLLQLLTDRSH